MLLRRLRGEGAPDYLAVLVSMELSLHSLEVVSRLTGALDIPQDFINAYIAACIASCDRAEVRGPCPLPCYPERGPLNCLTGALDMPQNFINAYTAACIASCNRAEVRGPSPGYGVMNFDARVLALLHYTAA